MDEERFRRIAPRPERPHLPFEWGQRHGPLFAPNILAMVVCVIVGAGLAALLTMLLAHVGAP